MDPDVKNLSGVGAAPVRPSRILVVDDDAAIRALLSEVLSEEGYEVTTANGGMEAINILDTDRFDLIITDIMMPEADGMEVLLAARRIDPECPVIMITGYPAAETIERLTGLGASDYVTKPFSPDLIKRTVAKNLERKNTKRT